MEKPKRNSQNRPFFSLLMFALIFIVGFALGIVALNAYKSAENSGSSVLLTDNQTVLNSACSPLSRDYPEAIDVELDAETTQSVGVSSGQVVLLATTGTPYAMTGGQNAAVPTSVALMGATPVGTPIGSNAQTIMTIPGTYTPVANSQMMASPMGTQAPIGTQAPQQQINRSQNETRLTNPLSAGEIDDNAEWDVYLTYRENFREAGSLSSPIDDVDVSNRQIIQVVNMAGEPILGALVEVFAPDGTILQSSCTYATGLTQFFPNIYDAAQQVERFQLRVSKNGLSTEAEMRLSSELFRVELDSEQTITKLDLLFLIDATGSMDDEIAAVTNNITYISEQIDALPDEIDVRYALVSFKDPYYPTQVWDFTSDVNLFQSLLATLYTAGGSGETLNDGLDRALHAVHWRGDDTVKLIFMIGDEPPDVYEEHPSYAISMLDALYAGIKVHPIASSGLDVQGEYIFRQLAQASMGHFIFLSYDNGATAVQDTGSVTGSVAEEPAGQYNVEALHEIVLNLIRAELGFTNEE